MSTFTLLGKGGEKKDCFFQLPDRAIGIGTDPNKCSIIYLHSKGDVSAFHCQLAPKQGFWTLTDYSDKGTWLNGKKMNPYQAYRLKEGDVFYLATLENSFCFAEDKTVNVNQGQIQNPPWPPQNQGQTQNPPWPPQNQGQTQNPSWPPQNQGQTQELGIKEKFLTSNGRLDRRTYITRGFYLTALNAIIWFLLGIVLTVTKASTEIVVALSALVFLAIIVPGLMLGIRRLHDLDKSGWYLLLGLVPILNLYILYLLLAKEGTHGVNRFGAEYHYRAPLDATQRNLEEEFLTFDGRLNRKPYILRLLCLLGSAIVIGLLAAFIMAFVGAGKNDIILITQIEMYCPMYPFPLMCIRRLHDLDKSGWFILIMLVPIINLLFIVYLLVAKGTTEPNRFGNDPLT